MSDLRSCYSTDCRFFADDPRPSTIHWYFVDEETPDLPFGTIFTPNVWLDVPEGDQDLGEVPAAARTWQDGTAPFPVAGDGHYCGTQEDFRLGGSLPAAPPPLNAYGGLACCPTPREPFIHHNCTLCPRGAWSTYTLRVTGLGPLPLASSANGFFDLIYQGGCTWQSVELPFADWPGHTFHYTMAREGSTVGVGLDPDGIVGSVIWTDGPTTWDCLSVLSVPFVPPAAAPFSGSPDAALLPGIASATGPFCPAQAAFLPSVLLIRTPRPVLGLGNTLAQQDCPFNSTRACVYTGTLLWDLPSRLRNIVQLQTTATITFGPGGLVTLSSQTPSGFAFSYTAALPAWDLSPAGLVLVGGSTLLSGLPLAATLFSQSDLPP